MGSNHYTNPKLLAITNVLNTLVLIGSIIILVMLSIDVFIPATEYTRSIFLKTQLWVCVLFISDYFFRLYMSPKKGHFILHNIILLIVSIPYLNIEHYMNWHLSADMIYVIRAMPIIRGAYGIAIMVKWITKSPLTSLLITYITTIAILTYFASLIFFTLEVPSNSMVHTYGDALWWACMDVTTVGSNIYAVTPIGKFLSVFLAASGMMMFPIFTVYITQRVQQHKKQQS